MPETEPTLPAIWLDGTLHFCAGSHEQKAKNLKSNPRCILTTGTSLLRSGLVDHLATLDTSSLGA